MANSFRTVRKNTIVVAEEIGEKDYGFRAAPDIRTVAQMLAHIGLSAKMQLQMHGVDRITTLEGFDFPGLLRRMTAEEQALTGKEEIVAFLRQEGDRFASWLESLSDDFLAEQVSLPGPTPSSKTRFEMILGVKEHEMHHRSQLMLIERMLGVVPHITREMQARMAAMAGAAGSARN